MKKTLLALSLGALGLTAASYVHAGDGYVTQPDGTNVMSGYGLCVHSGYWKEDLAAVPCDGARAPIAASAPAPMPQRYVAPAPAVAAAPQAAPQPMYEKVALSADVLFEFNSAVLKDEGRRELDKLADRISGASLDEVNIVGHTDRIGSQQYNRSLSERRAQAVQDYLRSRTTSSAMMRTAGRGEAEPVTGASCQRMGRESGANKRLVQCLQPDRRVEIHLSGQRLATPTGTVPAASGGTRPASMTR